ncbi:nuclease-related domain-containing protein [Cerasicoccus frondis]|uniref:nuclease-related domain-containing protein n=1 Tax=Cerasicoccus frondis TaxID=490090 RepID=UPI0028529BBE|nr:nuclease-related domain-containing protein [Cerasicoccus frondis]
MASMAIRIFFAFILSLPAMWFAGWAFLDYRKKKTSARPFSNDTSRPPGESTRRKLEDLQWDYVGKLLFIFMLAWLSIFLFLLAPRVPTDPNAEFNIWTFLFVITALAVLFFTGFWQSVKLRALLKKVAAYSLGFDGERHVGQALNRQMRRPEVSCVYHDFVFERAGKKFNIDHVVAGPGGVFVIETKTRRKPLDADQKPNYKVRYDGQRLHFPQVSTDEPIAQAQANARTFAEWLSGQLGHQISVTPIIVIPGWWIDYQNQGSGPAVINDAMIKSYAFHSPYPLETITLNRIDAALWRENAESLN